MSADAPESRRVDRVPSERLDGAAHPAAALALVQRGRLAPGAPCRHKFSRIPTRLRARQLLGLLETYDEGPTETISVALHLFDRYLQAPKREMAPGPKQRVNFLNAPVSDAKRVFLACVLLVSALVADAGGCGKSHGGAAARALMRRAPSG